MSDVIEALKSALTPNCLLEGDEISARSAGYWDSSPLQARLVLRPATTGDVSKILKICHHHGQTIITHGGLTGCANGAATGPDNIVLSLERMNAIEEIDVFGGVAVVQAGSVLETVQKAVAAQDMLFALETSGRGDHAPSAALSPPMPAGSMSCAMA